jgi:PIN domain nuclease of toxin-antitoxin system
LSAEPAKLSPTAANQINDPQSALGLSQVSILEIVLKHSAGKLQLPEAPRLWIPKQLDFFQISLLSLSPDIIYLAGELPKIHTDPFDRLIAAEAIIDNLQILTPDAPMRALGAKCIW